MRRLNLPDLLAGPKAPLESANDVAAAQAARARGNAPRSALFTLFTSLVLLVAFWGDPALPAVGAWATAGGALALGWVRLGRRSDTDGQRAKSWIFWHTVACGVVWGGLVALLAMFSGSEHSLVLGVLSASLLCIGAFMHAPLPAASLIFSLTVVAGSVSGFLLGGHPFVAETALLLFGCLAAMRHFTRQNARQLIREHRSAVQLRESEATIRMLLRDFESHSADWLWRTDAEHRIIDPSVRFREAADLGSGDLRNASFLALFPADSARELGEVMRARRSFRDLILRAGAGPEECWWSLSGQPCDDGGYRGVCSDITLHRTAEARIAHVRDFDALTGLPNRNILVKALGEAETVWAEGGPGWALFHVDLDNFKTVNDMQGHDAGDAFLRVIGQVLRDAVGEGAFVSRLGSDEFAVLVRHTGRVEAEVLAEVIVDALLAPIVVAGREILMSGSVGVAIGPEDGPGPAAMLKNAELALYRAKAQGRGNACFFESEMDVNARWKADLEADLRAALANDAMDVHFQPLVDTRSGEVNGYETLLRWNRPRYGLVSPLVFINCAEETGIIIPLGEWVIRKAISEAALWTRDVPVAINLSPSQLANPALISTVVSALASSGLDPSRLEIEITESVLMSETEHNLRVLHALRNIGARISLDDFGTGYSSLAYLDAFPFSKIKIDQKFVRDIGTNPANQAIVRAVIALAKDLGMAVTAEGIENEQQAAILASLGATQVQGFLYSRPIPACEIERRQPEPGPRAAVHTLQRAAGF
jgi:diguanylate cyclase (GGDEF)-like protein